MKTALSVMLAVLLLCACLPAGVLAAGGDGAMEISSAEANAGDTVTLTVDMTSNPGFAYLEVKPEYDASLLEAPAMTGTGLTGWTIQTQAVWAEADNTDYTGQILTLEFRVREGAAGDISVSADVNAFNEDEETVTFTVTPGSIHVPDAQTGEAVPAAAATVPPSLPLPGDAAPFTGDLTGLYARVAMLLSPEGVIALCITQAMRRDGTVPAFALPGLLVAGINIILVPSPDNIPSPAPSAADAYRFINQ